MEHLECPIPEIWDHRREWFDKKMEDRQHPLASYFINDHATALLVDLQCCYCSGAWLAVIILSISIIDAQLRDGSGNRKMGTAQLLRSHFTGENIDWLRKLRNQYVHVDLDNPALEMEDQYNGRDQMQEHADKAVMMVLHALFQDPGT